MTANIVLVLVFDSGARIVPDRLLSVGCWVFTAPAGRNKGRGTWKPRATRKLMATGTGTVKETGLFWPILPFPALPFVGA
jgi:hypothetical protein